MRSRTLLLITTVFCLAAPASASAYFGHVIAAGESLSSVAATDGLSVDQLAAANGISPDSQLIAGATLQIPPQDSSSAAAPSESGSTSSSSSSEASSSSASASDASASSSSSPGSGYTVRYGDTLSAIAARYGTTVDALASANGLDPAGILPTGVTLSISGSGSSSSAEPVSTSSSSSSTSDGNSSSAVMPTPETVSASDVGNVAAANGVSPSLAEAVGYQESGFNNNLVSSTGATGVMQIEPGTWSDINRTLVSPPPLSPTSAQDNIRGGVLLLHSLLDQTGGDPSLAAAGYYQGLQSVREHGLFSDTQHYVNNVMALRQRFGGP